MLVSERRAGYIAVMIAFVASSLIVLFTVKRKAFVLIAVPVLVAGASLSAAVLEQHRHAWAARARGPLDQRPDPRDAASNAWRDLEAINVRATIASDPLLGIGFGRPFLQVVDRPEHLVLRVLELRVAPRHPVGLDEDRRVRLHLPSFALITAAIARSVWLAKTLKDPNSERLRSSR